MKFISWNVNGIRANWKKGFFKYLQEENPDIIGLQEFRATEDQVSKELENIKTRGYEIFLNPAEKKGYSGTAIFTKKRPNHSQFGLPQEEHNHEGRVITLEYETFFFVTVYTPNSKGDLSRLEYRQKWDRDFLTYMKTLHDKKPVIFCGDLNVAHTEIDLANPKANKNNAGFTPEERNGFDHICKETFVDSFRFLYPEVKSVYTWWSNFGKARERNVGWRIDYFCVSEAVTQKLEDVIIQTQVIGSDHCPVVLLLTDVNF